MEILAEFKFMDRATSDVHKLAKQNTIRFIRCHSSMHRPNSNKQNSSRYRKTAYHKRSVLECTAVIFPLEISFKNWIVSITLKFRRTFITMLRVSMINIFIWFVISNCCCCLWLPWHLVALFREPGKTCWSYQLTLTYMIIRGPWMGNLLRSGNYIIVM